ncbi:MAG: MarR family transcriptional regulator [Ornithinimicrobium sp.]|uniref:MarR family winged helix-turn-helix transcriptional regulator n=1 Tax=Ornithinimicrobium sp. TaxID=1977084 RepID=UPI0026DF6E0C|nr:MarR family transcriptional regulator [Ornithinimicrobium sp.]MDO5738992.1 MarR family transcriptional regulator [Ornithinimicrobium sp.]
MVARPDVSLLCAQIAAAEAELHTIAMRLAPPLPIPTDLTIRQLQVLAILRSAPDSTGQALADLLGVSTPTISGIIDRVACKDWVERRPDPQDRRRVLLRVTAAAEHMLAELEVPAQEAKAVVFERLSADELADVARLYDRLRDIARDLLAEGSDTA